MTRKGKRANIPPKAQAIIMHRALQHPREQRTPLAESIRAQFERLGYDMPEIEVLERKISWYRNHGEDSPQDKLWSTATLDEYPIPPEALPAVLKVGKSRIEKGRTFTIREAKWVSRLSALQQDIKELSFIARRHARVERASEFFKLPYDSTFLDMLLMGLPQPAELASDKNSFSYYLAYVDSDDLLEYIKELRTTEGGQP